MFRFSEKSPMIISDKPSLFGANLMVPIVLWGHKALQNRIVQISTVQNGRVVLTGSDDGQVMQWIVDESLGWIQPQMVLLAHESAISCISSISIANNSSKFVTCSEDGQVCLWDSVDGRVIDSVRANYVHRRIRPHTLKNAQDILFCVGDYADVIVLHAYDLNVLFTLSSRTEPDWVTSLTLVHPLDKHDVLIGVSLPGVIKMWSLFDLDGRESNNVIFEDESKVLCSRNVHSIACSEKNLRIMLVVCGSSWQIIDPKNLSQLIISECAIEALEGVIVDIDKIAIGFADSTIVLFQLPRNKLCGRQILQEFGEQPTNVANIEQPFVFALLKGISSTPIKPSLTPIKFYFESESSTENQAPRRIAYRVDEQGSISLWHIPKNLELLVNEFIRNRRPIVYEPTIRQRIGDAWNRLSPPPPTLAKTEASRKVTATIYVGTQGKLFHGRDDGTIMMMNACHVVIAQLLEGFNNDATPFRLLVDGHTAAVNCFAYPFDESPRYDQNLLLSGGADFAVIVWNITIGEKVHRFCCQGGIILRFLVPPSNCSARVLNSVCAIAGDNSAALLSLKELKCILLASRQQFPIIDVRWRPLDDFMLLRCEDNSVYVWQIETANLDRIVAGLVTDEVVEACSEQMGLSSEDNEDEAGASPAVQMLRALKHKNVAAVKNIKHLGSKRATSGISPVDICCSPPPPPAVEAESADEDEEMRKIAQIDGKQSETFAPIEMTLIPSMDIIQLSNCSDEAHLILFNIDALISGLMTLDQELCSGTSGGSSADMADGRLSFNTLINKRVNDLVYPPQDNGVSCHQREPSSSRTRNSPSTSSSTATLIQQQSLYMDTAKLLLSLLHAWDLDENLDNICLNDLKLCKPKIPICFGTISKKGHISLDTPYCSGKISALDDFTPKYFAKSIHWQESRALTTFHLLAIISLSNSLMTLRSRSYQIAVKKLPLRRVSSAKSSDGMMSESEGQLIKQGWSSVTAHHCVLLPDFIKPRDSYASPRIDLLARKWQDSCIEIRDAAQALLIRELSRIGTDGRRRLIERWSNFLPTLIDPSISIFGGHPLISSAATYTANHVQNSNSNHVAFAEASAIKTGETAKILDDASTSSQIISPSANNASSASSIATASTATKVSTPKRPPSIPPIPPRNASTGELPPILPRSGTVTDDESNRSTRSSTARPSPSISSLVEPEQLQGPSSAMISNKIQEDQMLICNGVFQVRRNQATAIVLLGVMGTEFPSDLQRNVDLCRATAHSLLELLLAPESPLIPQNSPLRRAAIDLLGRGFTVWQPHLDLSKVLLGLLNLASDSERLLPHSYPHTQLSPEADACRTARHTLSLIASARPQALITALSMEVARYNAVAQHQTIQHSIPSPLMKARCEVLRLLEQLADKQYNFVVELIVPVGDILVHCMDLSQLKQRTLAEIFPPIAKFYMVAYCPQTRRLAFGGKNGTIVVHELRASKAQTIQAHRAPITALAFSQDSKYLAAYAAQDAKISFWQTQQTFLGMGQSQIRCAKSVPAPGEFPVVSPGGTYQLFRARLVWINSKSLTLMLPNGKENRFTV